MKRSAAILTATLIHLALPGCVEDKPARRLESTDRNERIEAIHDAQNRYSVPAKPPENKPAQPAAPVIIPSTPSSNGSTVNIDAALVGRWKGSWIRCQDYQFNADGTCTDDTLLYAFKGKWSVPSPGTLLCCYSVFGDYQWERYTYRIKGDTLELYDGFSTVAFTKAKQ